MAPRRGLSYRQQQTLSLLALAILPIVLVAALVLGQVDAAVRAEADGRAVDAARAVESILGSDAATLDRLAESYATWNVLQDEVAGWHDQAIAASVIDFQVDQGGVDAAVVVAGDHAVAGGPSDVSGPLEGLLRAALDTPGAIPSTGLYADLAGGVYHVALQPIDLSGRSGPGVEAARGRAGLAFAERLGSDFVVVAKRLTGFDVAVYDASGTLTTASDQAIAAQSAPAHRGVSVATDALVAQRRANDIVAVAFPVGGGTPGAAGTIVVATQLGLAAAIGANLLPYLALLLALVLVFAASLAVYLADLLRRRLGALEAGIAAVAAGDLTARLPAGDRDPLDRLGASHNRLAAALERRERIVWRSLEALEALRPERGATPLLADVLDAGRSIFDLDACWLRDADDVVVAIAPPGQVAVAPAPVSADLGAIPGHRLEGAGPSVATWTVADRALFGLFAREAGVALRNAGLHEETARRAERLGRAHALQREFVRGLGHNLQAPLARILMASEGLAVAPGLDEAGRRRADGINADADRLARVVGELLTATRLDAGVFVPASEPFALAPAVRRAWHALGSDRRLDLVDRSSGWLAVGDREAAEQVLWILLDNAIRYAPAGAVHVTIAADEPGELTVRVRDEGPGVPRAERARIFRRFQRGSSAGGHEGTGLGLDVARRLLRTMGGRIRYEEGPGDGATFAFTLPAERVVGPE